MTKKSRQNLNISRTNRAKRWNKKLFFIICKELSLCQNLSQTRECAFKTVNKNISWQVAVSLQLPVRRCYLEMPWKINWLKMLVKYLIIMPFNYFIQLISFFTPWKHKKTLLSYIFRGFIKRAISWNWLNY